MEYKDIRCPVCGVPFDDDDDIVVCPECGAPHHRICYERLGKCANAEQHGDSFTWNEKESSAFSICPSCGAKNPKDAIFCNSCARPLTENGESEFKEPPRSQSPFGSAGPQAGMPFGFGGFNSDMYGAMGMSRDEELSDGVKAEDYEKYVKTSAFYYLPVFKNIKRFGRSRFNFSSALFSGGWFLYRKMYLVGAIFLALMAATFVAETFFINSFVNTYNNIINSLSTRANIFTIADYAARNLSPSELWMFLISPLASFSRIIIMVISGAIGNKLYFKHCTKKITKIKSENPTGYAAVLEKVGGTNNVAAIVVFVCYIAYNIVTMLI